MHAFSLVFPSSPPTSPGPKLGDGRPAMVFVSVYKDKGGERHILLGCSEPNWKGLDDVAKTTRGMRDHRLNAYIPVAKLALAALHAHEKRILFSAPGSDNANEEQVDEKTLWDARKSAREAMKTDPAFLGGTHESGMALRTPSWEHNMACHACASMMGYKDTKAWKEKAQKAYHADHFC